MDKDDAKKVNFGKDILYQVRGNSLNLRFVGVVQHFDAILRFALTGLCRTPKDGHDECLLCAEVSGVSS